MKLPRLGRRRQTINDSLIELAYDACQVDFDETGGIRFHSPTAERAVIIDDAGAWNREPPPGMKPLTMSAARVAQGDQFAALAAHWAATGTRVNVVHSARVPDSNRADVDYRSTTISDGRVTATFQFAN